MIYLALMTAVVLWFWIFPDCAGEWFYKAHKKYRELSEKGGDE